MPQANTARQTRMTYGPQFVFRDSCWEYLLDLYATGEVSDADNPRIVLRRDVTSEKSYGRRVITARWQVELDY